MYAFMSAPSNPAACSASIALDLLLRRFSSACASLIRAGLSDAEPALHGQLAEAARRAGGGALAEALERAERRPPPSAPPVPLLEGCALPEGCPSGSCAAAAPRPPSASASSAAASLERLHLLLLPSLSRLCVDALSHPARGSLKAAAPKLNAALNFRREPCRDLALRVILARLGGVWDLPKASRGRSRVPDPRRDPFAARPAARRAAPSGPAPAAWLDAPALQPMLPLAPLASPMSAPDDVSWLGVPAPPPTPPPRAGRPPGPRKKGRDRRGREQWTSEMPGSHLEKQMVYKAETRARLQLGERNEAAARVARVARRPPPRLPTLHERVQTEEREFVELQGAHELEELRVSDGETSSSDGETSSSGEEGDDPREPQRREPQWKKKRSAPPLAAAAAKGGLGGLFAGLGGEAAAPPPREVARAASRKKRRAARRQVLRLRALRAENFVARCRAGRPAT
ncbi:hypothetical protein TeGR_g123, partial [Tetraparma gracilis]